MAEPNLENAFKKALDAHALATDLAKKIPKWKKAEIQDGIKNSEEVFRQAKKDLLTAQLNPDEVYAGLQEGISEQNPSRFKFTELKLPQKMVDVLSPEYKVSEYYVIEPEEKHKFETFVGRAYAEGEKPRMLQANPLTPVRLIVRDSKDYGVLAVVSDNRGLEWHIVVEKPYLVGLLQAAGQIPK